MTFIALHYSVRSEQREPVEMLFYQLGRYSPSLHGVAPGAIGAELTAMNVGVAVRAVLADIGKDRARVALGAVDLLMHSAYRKSRAVVIELRDGADGRPTGVGVTVFARKR
jgi:hypothetical protein